MVEYSIVPVAGKTVLNYNLYLNRRALPIDYFAVPAFPGSSFRFSASLLQPLCPQFSCRTAVAVGSIDLYCPSSGGS